MTWENADEAELAVDIAAAAILAGAVGFCLWAGGSDVAATSLSAVTAWLAALLGLRRIMPEIQGHALPPFELENIAPIQMEAEALILEDVLGEVGADARVVRLFGRSQSHFSSNQVEPALPDASRALSDALAELRRSLH